MANVQRSVVRSTKCLHFPKCFIGFRAIYRLNESRYSYQGAEHILRNFSIILSVCKCNIIYFYRSYIYEIAIPTTHPPQVVPLPSQGKALKTKNASLLRDTAYIKHLLSRSTMHFFCITNIHRKPNKKVKRKKLF